MADEKNTLIIDLPEYVEQNKTQLYVDSVIPDETKWFDWMLGVKHAEALHTLDSEVVLQAQSCGWNPSGNDSLSERYVLVHLVEIEKEICYSILKETYLNYSYKWEAGLEGNDFFAKWAESNVAAVKRAVNELAWAGDSGLSITGFIADIEEVSGDTITFGSGDTAVAKVDAMVAGLTAKMLRKGVRIYMSQTDFRNYVLESNATCCANRAVLDAASASITYAGDSRITLVPMEGLENQGVMVAATPDALVLATDLKEADGNYDLWFDKTSQNFMLRILFAFGTAVRFPDEVKMGAEGE